ncbi:ComEC/Rec2 family competence protein [Candidatus Berkelbacteria bacterium]|nr:ComEC/Rec2 family competence protein [Candidatus Berkelbacteria bacterium]
MPLTSSKLFLWGVCFAFLGMSAGKFVELPTELLLILFIAWIYVLVIGHEPIVELVAMCAVGFVLGYALWQATEGEAWLKSGFIDRLNLELTNLRIYLSGIISYAILEPYSSLMAGILLGNKVQMDKDLLNVFRSVGLSHLIAVSGYNLTVISQNINSLLKGVIGRRSVYVSLAVIVLFIILTGAPASVLRAGAMATLLSIATLLGRPSRSQNLLIIGSFLLVIFEPKIIFEIGFQLSVAATYGLIRIAPLFGVIIEKIPGPKFVYQICAETFGATLMTAPILVFYFQQFAPLGLVSNILVLPIIPLLMALGVFGLGLSIITPSFSSVFFLPVWPLLNWIVLVANKGAAIAPQHTTTEISIALTVWVVLIIVFAVELLNALVKSK